VPNVGPTELIVILVIALLVFGPKRLPEIGRTLGRSLKEFRRASSELRDEIQRNLDPQDETPAVADGHQAVPPPVDPAPSIQPGPAEQS
jgi:sec-independent protein translocase protein TatA